MHTTPERTFKYQTWIHIWKTVSLIFHGHKRKRLHENKEREDRLLPNVFCTAQDPLIPIVPEIEWMLRVKRMKKKQNWFSQQLFPIQLFWLFLRISLEHWKSKVSHVESVMSGVSSVQWSNYAFTASAVPQMKGERQRSFLAFWLFTGSFGR